MIVGRYARILAALVLAVWICGTAAAQGTTIDEIGTVAAGETVTIGQPLVQVESDKALLDVEAPAAGRLARIAQPKGSKVPVGALLAVID